MNTRRLTGMGAVATLALAVLVFGCVLGVTAGPREALKLRTQTLREILAHISPVGQTITVSTSWSQFTGAAGMPQLILTDGQLRNLEDQFNRDFNKGVLHLAPVSADWVSMTTGEYGVDSALAGTGGHPVEMEVSYRLPYSGNVRVLAGNLSAPAPAASSHIAGFFPTINVAVTRQTARKFGLKVGSAVRTIGPPLPIVGHGARHHAQGHGDRGGEPARFVLLGSRPVPGSARAERAGSRHPRTGHPACLPCPTSPPRSSTTTAPFLNLQWVLPVNLSVLLGRPGAAAGRGAAENRQRRSAR